MLFYHSGKLSYVLRSTAMNQVFPACMKEDKVAEEKEKKNERMSRIKKLFLFSNSQRKGYGHPT